MPIQLSLSTEESGGADGKCANRTSNTLDLGQHSPRRSGTARLGKVVFGEGLGMARTPLTTEMTPKPLKNHQQMCALINTNSHKE